jgi:ferredoxin
MIEPKPAMLSCVLFSLFINISAVTAFAPVPIAQGLRRSVLHESLLSVTLDKPLGILLEEMEEGAPKGVKVQDLNEEGSAYASEYKDQLVGLKVAKVMGKDVSSVTFERVMDAILEAPSTVTIEFELATTDESSINSEILYEVGALVTIKVLQEGKPDMDITAKVGDNLRQILLQNDVELYRGLKKKMGNCGGGGQCTFCTVQMMDEDGWGSRSDWEEGKIGKKLDASYRMACMNSIAGPATVRTL